MTREFTNLDAGEQRAVLYEKISSVESHLVKQNSKIFKNGKDILIIKVALITIGIIASCALGFGVPAMPWF